MRLYQQIARSGDAEVPLPDDSTHAPASADIVAQKAIDQLARANPGIYEPFEKEAAEAMKDAEASNDPAKLLAVAQTYPNATVAPKAMLAAANAYEAAGDARAARHVSSTSTPITAPPRTGRLCSNRSPARNYSRRVRAARAWPSSCSARAFRTVRTRSSRKALKLPDGAEIAADTHFSAAVDQVRKFAYQQQETALPTFDLPFPNFQAKDAKKRFPKPFKATPVVIANVAAVVAPLRHFDRPDRLVTWFDWRRRSASTSPPATSRSPPAIRSTSEPRDALD